MVGFRFPQKKHAKRKPSILRQTFGKFGSTICSPAILAKGDWNRSTDPSHNFRLQAFGRGKSPGDPRPHLGLTRKSNRREHRGEKEEATASAVRGTSAQRSLRPKWLWLSKPCWNHFGVGAPPILEPISVGIGMFTGGYGILTHGQISRMGLRGTYPNHI